MMMNDDKMMTTKTTTTTTTTTTNIPFPIDIETILQQSKECDFESSSRIGCFTSLVPVGPTAAAAAAAAAVPVLHNTTTTTTTTTTWCSNVYFGVHHKSGTVLGERIAEHWCSGGGGGGGGNNNNNSKNPNIIQKRNFLLDQHIKSETYLDGKQIAHFIRDPLEMIVSAYQYHLISKEEWLITSGYQSLLRNATTLEDGLEMEYKRSIKSGVNEMINFHRYMTDNEERFKNVFTVRLDLIQYDELNFRIFGATLKKWFGGGGGGGGCNENENENNDDDDDDDCGESLIRCCFVSPQTRSHPGNHIHVSKTDEKPKMRNYIMKHHGEEIKEMRKILGFPLVGLEQQQQQQQESITSVSTATATATTITNKNSSSSSSSSKIMATTTTSSSSTKTALADPLLSDIHHIAFNAVVIPCSFIVTLLLVVTFIFKKRQRQQIP